MLNLLKNQKIQLLLILIITSLTYINIFQNGFVWDDNEFILEWDDIKSFDIVHFFKGATPAGHPGVYRPMRSVFYSLGYKLWGLSLAGNHALSVITHLICTMLVYLIANEIAKNKFTAFLCSLLFGIHPVHTESITYMTASFDTIGVVLFLASFYLYLKGSRFNFILSSLFALLAFFTYEMTLVLPLLIVFHDICFKRIKKDILFDRVKKYSIYVIAALFYASIRFFIIHIGSRADYLADSFYLTMLTMSKAFVRYVLLVIYPVNLTINHTISNGILSIIHPDVSKEAILAQSIFDFDIVLSLIILLILFLVILVSLKKHPLLSFCIGWFFISLLPVSNIIPQTFILAERYLYIASFGFCLILSSMIYKMYNSKRLRIVSILTFVLITIFLSALTISRNKDWKGPLTFWSKTVGQAPGSVLALNNLGKAYFDKGEFSLADEQYKKALDINPMHANSYNRLGMSYASQGDLDLAVANIKKALSIDSKLAEAHNNLALVYSMQGNLDAAIDEYKRALSIEPGYKQAKANLLYVLSIKSTNLGVDYKEKGELDAAIKEYKKAIAYNPDNAVAHFNLGNAYHDSGKYALAVEEYKNVVEISRKGASTGNIYYSKEILDIVADRSKNYLLTNTNT